MMRKLPDFTHSREQQPDLRLIEADQRNDEHDGGIYLPNPEYKDLAIPTTVYRGQEIIGGASVKFSVEVPDEIIDTVPVVYAHGYCAKEAYPKLRNATARNGKTAITFDTPRVQKNLAGLHRKHILSPERLLAQAVYGAMRGASRIADETEIDTSVFDLSGHSMGGRSATLAALQHPNRVRTVILNQSAGLYDHSFGDLVQRIPAFGKDDLIPAMRSGELADLYEFGGLALNGLYYIVRNPLKTAVEGISISNSDIRPDVKRLRDIGIKTAIMIGEADNYISGKKTREESAGLADVFVIFSDPKANHLAPQKMPLMVAAAHAQVLKRLHEKTSLSLVSDVA
ncbi:MAG: alpha/beta hydrolase [Candidatus Saccharimonadales bacterium]